MFEVLALVFYLFVLLFH